ncbi:hypothetical protein FH972_013734 [Carpinus fangiana]|uniref:KIB1-4 beta-propeller domain-containing protein n=1 Tax=Carpinus fangiana TaxID=176857 RepID=A0A5N6R7M8_9ROSI|nr:hypothetical protein FH972_013734 [Carpinus fangiana]
MLPLSNSQPVNHNPTAASMTSQPTRPTISSYHKLLDQTVAVALLTASSSSSTTLQPSFSSTLSLGSSSTFLRFSPSPVSLASTWEKSIRSLVNNSSNFIAVAILYEGGKLAYCKNGDQSWTFMRYDVGCDTFGCWDATYYKEQFYAVNMVDPLCAI